MTLVQGRAHVPSISKDTTLPAVPSLALPALNLATKDPLENFFDFSVSNFLQLLRRCINMILSGRDVLELGHPMMTSYLDNIERIGGHARATPYRARLESLEEQV